MGRDTVPGFAAKLRVARESSGLTLMALAERSGTHYTTIAKLETEERSPSLRLALTLADALDVSLLDLLPKKKGAKRG